jgi:hypothetical protein
MSQAARQRSGNLPDINQRNADWYIDKLVQYLVFLSGISAIVLIVGIFVFVTIEGLGFLFEDFSFREFFLSPWWEPTDEDEPTYGILGRAHLRHSCADGRNRQRYRAGDAGGNPVLARQRHLRGRVRQR